MSFQVFTAIQRNRACCLLIIPILAFFLLSCGSGDETDSQQQASQQSTDEPLPEITKLLPASDAISGYEASGNPKVYSRQDIWDYLSQTAEVYLTNHFSLMAVETYHGNDDDSLVVELASFSNARSAFGIFAGNREIGVQIVDIEPKGFISNHTLHYARGMYYLQVHGTSETADESLVEVAEAISSEISGLGFVHPHAGFLPAEDMIPYTLKISLRDNLPHNERPDFVSAVYVLDSDTMRVYYQHQSRLGMSFAVEEFIEEGGTVEEYLMGGEYQSLVGNSPQFGTVYCAVDEGSVCAVTGFSDRSHAKTMVERIFQTKGE